jgi:DNA (cytosine-5)-methyltransferase 1
MDHYIMNAVDLFSGCGGLSLGFEKAGHTILAAFDNWDAAIACYKLNFDHPIHKNDLSDVENITEELKKIQKNSEIDIVMGGPPCQDFSHAGQRSEGNRANLTASFANIISNVRPPWFVMENVDRALKSNAYSEARQIFKSAGYGLTEVVLDASKCGVPQKRKRLFVIGSLNHHDNFLLDLLTKNQTPDRMTVRDYLGDSLYIEHYYRHPRNYNRRGIFSIDEPAPTVRGVNRPVPKGYPGHAGDPVEITENLRPLTTNERALLQTFPPEFQFVGNKTNQEQMVGNAVPVNLSTFVANALNEFISQENQIEATYLEDVSYG